MKFLIAIPALNEENSIDSIIKRTLDARQFLLENSPVTRVDITVVSDGSTDRTVELANRYTDRIRLIVFEKNRGYGSAIKQAWDSSPADLLGFLDADGTCDPKFFATLCTALIEQKADLALGCRLNPQTHMPAIRKIGNFLYASLLTLLSKRRVRDTASGMRVLTREAYENLLPLPNGLHFTPAMSARALLGPNGGMKLIEIDMPYYEREGRSKLRVLRDGFRFLGIIMQTALLYHPARLLGIVGGALFLLAVGLMFAPVAYYWQTRTVQEWMLYRFILGHLAAIAAFLIFSAAYLARRIVRVVIEKRSASLPTDWLDNLVRSPVFLIAPLLLMVAGTALVGSNLVAHAIGHAAYEHWSRFITVSFLWLVAGILIITRGLAYFLDLIAVQLDHLKLQALTAESRIGSES